MEALSDRGKFVKVVLTIIDIMLACISYNISISVFYSHMAWLVSNDNLVVCVFIAIYWAMIEEWLRTNEVYRSRSYGYVLFYSVMQNVIGVALITITVVMFGFINYGRGSIVTFCLLSSMLSFLFKIIFYKALRNLRRRGFNIRKVIFVCDKTGDNLLSLLYSRYEWGYKIVAVVGDRDIVDKYGSTMPVYDVSTINIDELITTNVDEVIFARKYDS